MLTRNGILALSLAGLTLAGARPALAQSNTAAGALLGGASGAIIGGAVTGRASGAAAGALIGGTAGALMGAEADRAEPLFVWGPDGRCYLQLGDGEVQRVARANCE